jgi:hypothetical protein
MLKGMPHAVVFFYGCEREQCPERIWWVGPVEADGVEERTLGWCKGMEQKEARPVGQKERCGFGL